jgi:transposase-like protein
MVAYEFYGRDEKGKEYFIGILPERRKKTERISDESVMNWVKKILHNKQDMKNIYFIKVDMQNYNLTHRT